MEVGQGPNCVCSAKGEKAEFLLFHFVVKVTHSNKEMKVAEGTEPKVTTLQEVTHSEYCYGLLYTYCIRIVTASVV
jgi:hypothetical protein